MRIKSLTIYCSSSNNLGLEYYKLATNIGNFLASKSIKIIYGGGNLGMMGALSKSASDSGGKVVGIIPNFLIPKEGLNYKISKTIVVKNMIERKKKLFNLGDAFLILPGGSGTIEEATEVISWKFLNLHNKKIIIFNYNNFWDPLINMYNQTKQKKFGNKNLQSICDYVSTFKEFVKLFS